MAKSFYIGNIGEVVVKNLFDRFGYDAVIKNQKTYDIQCNKKQKFKIEVKYDFLSEKTGNIAVEYYNSRQKKPSGVINTECDIWIYVINDCGNKTVWAIGMPKFRDFLKDKSIKCKMVGSAGDGNADLILYKTDIILPLFTRLDTINNQKQFDKSIKEILDV